MQGANKSRVFRGATRGVLAAFALSLATATVAAQGSTGGSIGKQDKSISGSQDDGGTRSAPRKDRSSKAPSRRSEHGGRLDGQWNVVFAAKTQICAGSANGAWTISGGSLSGKDTTGSASGGSVRANYSGPRYTGTISGHLSGSSGTGTFQRSDGCVGTWAAAKQ
jgi:hypothetical protein